jgi:ariadne-1
MSWIDVQFIETATKSLTECRRMLKFSYIYGYYLPNHVNREIFEYLQADLEAGVEVMLFERFILYFLECSPSFYYYF